MPTSIPDNLKQYFWDSPAEKIDPRSQSGLVIQRLLDWNDFAAAKWVLSNFSTETIKKSIKSCRGWSRLSSNFWANYFGIPKNEVICLKPESRNQPRSHWEY